MAECQNVDFLAFDIMLNEKCKHQIEAQPLLRLKSRRLSLGSVKNNSKAFVLEYSVSVSAMARRMSLKLQMRFTSLSQLKAPG